MDQQPAISDDLAVLLEERAIVRALHEYAHAMDDGREEAWVEAFTPDAIFDVVEVVGGRRVHREEGAEGLEGLHGVVGGPGAEVSAPAVGCGQIGVTLSRQVSDDPPKRPPADLQSGFLPDRKRLQASRE